MTNFRMSALSVLSVVGLLLPGLVCAQSAPKSSPKTTTTPATSRTATSGASRSTTTTPNRQQELYDQYHGVNKKSVSTTTAPASATVAATPPQPTAPAPAPTPTVATSQPQLTAPAGSSSGFRIGFRAGVNFPVDLDEQVSEPVMGFVGGLVMQFGRGRLSFQPEINYSRTIRRATVFPFGDISASADQVVVPLFLKISTGTIDGTRFFLNVGPYGAYVASVAVDGVKQPLSSDDPRFSFGAAAGLGAMIKLGPGHITVEARGSYPLGDVERATELGVPRSIIPEGTVGYVFPLGSR